MTISAYIEPSQLLRYSICDRCFNVSHCPRQIKCDQYWPNRGTEIYGFMHITLLDVMELATYTIRTFHVVRVSVSDRTDTESASYGAAQSLNLQ